MDNFLWHKIDEAERERIKKEAKSIMDSFAKELEKVENELVEDYSVKRESQTRKETRTLSRKEFRKIFFENSPAKSGDFIKSEKGKWK